MPKDLNNLNKPKPTHKFTAFIRNTVAGGKYDKRNESDRQMLARVGKKFALIFFVVLMFEEIFYLLFEFLEIVFELIHLLIEVIEHWLEHLLEHTLHTNHHQSETIIVNSAIIAGLYRLFLAAPRLINQFKRNFLAGWLKHIRRESSCWRALPLNRKIKLVAAYAVGAACLLFLLTL